MQLPGERQQHNSVDITLYDRNASVIFAYLARGFHRYKMQKM